MRALKWSLAPLMMAWPLLIWWLHDHVGSWPLLVTGALLLAWRFPEARWLAVTAGGGLILLGLLGEAEWGVRAYPVAINTVMLALFSFSLWQGPPIIERLARLREPDLPESGVRYTRRVTQAWCLFFLINGSVAAWTACYASLSLWTLYNGVISYGLIALMFTGEWCCRYRLRRTSP